MATVRTSGEDELGELAADGRTFDLLVVNAGTTHEQALTAATISTEEFTRVLVTDALAPVRLVELPRRPGRP